MAGAAMGLIGQDRRGLALLIVSVTAIAVGHLPGRLERRVEVAMWADTAVALALWWLYGPIVGVDFVLFYVVAASSIVLPRRRAITTILVATMSELGQVPLHFAAERRPLPLFHPEAQVVAVTEFAAGVGLRTLAILAMGALFLTVAAIMRRAEVERDRSEARFRGLYEGAPIAYLTVDPTGRITSANETTGVLLGRDPADVVGARCIDLYAPGPGGRDRAAEVFLSARDGGEIRNEVLQLNADFGGDRWVSITAEPVRDERGDAVEIRAALVDATERRRVERLQADANAQLENLVADKDRFIASISHEIRTPLAGVVGFTETLRVDWGEYEDDERREFIRVISDQSREMSFLVEDLLVAARAELDELAVTRSPVDLREEIQMVMELCGHCDEQFDERVISEPEGETPLGLGDTARVRQVIRNLLTNALRHGGARIRFVLVPGSNTAVVEVRDSGPGIPDELRNSIFEPYATGGRVRGVTESVGLGLSVAAALTRLMQGELSYYRDGDESVFRLELPTAESDHCAA